MQLLVSVRSAAEVDLALAGGADIIDAKEPDRGSLGPVSAIRLAEILMRVPSSRTFSVALGDVALDTEVVAAITSLGLPSRPAPTFLKLGFAGVRSPDIVKGLLSTAIEVAAERRLAPLIVAVAYADADRAGALPPEAICRLAEQAGVAGVLLDTCVKDGAGLLRWLDPAGLTRWIMDARGAGLLTAVAGALGLDDVESIRQADPDILGVRGAVCVGGRRGQISTKRVRELRRLLGHGSGDHLAGTREAGETRGRAADAALATPAKSLKNNA
ncbi:MAG: (5-formylfuran-3-yl)methyl phosphate synthase [Gemmatimonadota bacterium]|nr:(5-formylfuran-3-yl)methyl phosphate synthase [Gemmatimonadota bacterium]